MKGKVFKWLMIGVPLVLVGVIGFVVLGSYLEHRDLVAEEKADFPPPGTLVDVNDESDRLHVYAEGEGEPTLVFMSGLGTSSPLYDFKPLYEELSDDYRIVVVERAGYGWSDISSRARDIDTVLDDTRAALNLSGEAPPYVLLPHSMAGIEALHWANQYPEEIEAIVGLDPLVPEYHKQRDEEPSFSLLIDFLMSTGLVRRGPDVFENSFPAMEKGLLSEADAEIARTIFFRRVQTESMKNELDSLSDNAQTVAEKGKPDIPFHVFIAGENEDEYWQESLTAYAEATNGTYHILGAGHYIHLEKTAFITEEIKNILE